MYVLILATISLIIWWILEYLRHAKNVFSVPVRIHINGTRGKSSVTRLVAAGLRAGNKKTIAKTTGTMPRVILEDGRESAIVRLAGANIMEQKYVFRFVKTKKPDVMVMECMAVNPAYQWITERMFVKSTISVITNSRLDHTDLMGETLESITKSMCNTIPKNGICFTSEEDQFPVMKKIADKRNTELRHIHSDDITDEDLAPFPYIEHPENVSLALAICEYVGVDKKTALKGMQEMPPDPGALKKYTVSDKETKKDIVFYNVFAANDPHSSELIWNEIISRLNKEQRIIILNNRADRYYRSLQLLDICKKLEFDYLFLTGERTEQLLTEALSRDISKRKVVRMGEVPPAQIYDKINELTFKDTHVVGIGNIAGKREYGNQIVKYFYKKSRGGE